MTEPDWLERVWRPMTMFRHVRNKLSLRKLQLLACAICRLEWEHITEPRLRAAIQTYERFADGQASDEETSAAVHAVREVLGWTVEGGIVRVPDHPTPNGPEEAARLEVEAATNFAPRLALGLAIRRVSQAVWLVSPERSPRVVMAAHERQVCDLFREIVGNPFRPWKAVPDFLGGGVVQPDGRTVKLTGTARQLAEGIRTDQAFDRLPILADALEESGVTDAELLAHLRRDGGHVRGCWALDVALGKS